MRPTLVLTLIALLMASPALAATCRLPAGVPDAQAAVIDAVNAERAKRNLPPVQPDPRLERAAAFQACDSAGAGRMSHRSTDGRDMAERVSDAGYDWSEVAENVALGQTGPAEVVADWMSSPPHRKNILNRNVTEAGVGIAAQADGQIHWVLNLARPR